MARRRGKLILSDGREISGVVTSQRALNWSLETEIRFVVDGDVRERTLYVDDDNKVTSPPRLRGAQLEIGKLTKRSKVKDETFRLSGLGAPVERTAEAERLLQRDKWKRRRIRSGAPNQWARKYPDGTVALIEWFDGDPTRQVDWDVIPPEGRSVGGSVSHRKFPLSANVISAKQIAEAQAAKLRS